MELKGITCKIPLDLHNQISEEIRTTESTMSKFIEMVIREHYMKGDCKMMGKGRTLAFQVSEELFQKVKEYLERYEKMYHRHLTQKEFVIGLIEEALEEAEEEFEAARAAEQEKQAESTWESEENEETAEEVNDEEPDEEAPCELQAEDTPQEDEQEPIELTKGDETVPDDAEEPQSPMEEDEETYA